jgi:hypothetical protein
MQASIDKLTNALTTKLAVELPHFTFPATILTPETSGISEPVQTTGLSKDVAEDTETPQETSETAPIPTSEPAKDATQVATEPTNEPTTEPATGPTTESNDTAKRDNGEAPSTETDSPTSPDVKKHVKRSSFFGGFFG